MFELGSLIMQEDSHGCTYFVVTKFGAHTIIEKLDDFIMRTYVVAVDGNSITLEELIKTEKQKIIEKGVADVPYN